MESLVISLLLFGVLVFLAWVFVKGIANMEPDGAAAGGFMILILIPVFIIVLIVFLVYTISSGGWLYLGLAILVPVYLFARLVRSDSGPSIPEKNEHLEKCSRICADPSIALEEIKADPDVIEHLPPEIRNRPEVIALTEDRAFVLQIISPEAPPFVDYQNRDAYQARRDRFGDSIFPGEKWRRLRYLPEHWRSDKEVMLWAIDIALGKCVSVSDRGGYDSMFLSGLDDLFSLIPEALLQDPIFLQEVEERMLESISLVIDYEMGNFSEDDIEDIFVDGIPSMDALEGLHEFADYLLEGFLELPEAENYSNPIPARLLTALSDAREEIDALAAEKEQQRLRKTLVDELSNLRNSKTADDDKS